jgi:hypothetical protein
MEQNKIILYQDDNEITREAVRFTDEDLWLTIISAANFCAQWREEYLEQKKSFVFETVMPDCDRASVRDIRSSRVD